MKTMLNKATKIKNSVIAIEEIDKQLELLEKFRKHTKRIRLMRNGDDQYVTYMDIEHPFEIQTIVDLIITEKKKTKEKIIETLNKNF
ncbi:MAG: hypothetical protein ACOC3V_04095 [bacterium]